MTERKPPRERRFSETPLESAARDYLYQVYSDYCDRWNVDVADDFSIQFCTGHHDKGQECDHEVIAMRKRTAPLYRHKKRDSVYHDLGLATLQVEDGTILKDGDSMRVYIDDETRLWTREVKEFHDGRFEKIHTTRELSATTDDLPVKIGWSGAIFEEPAATEPQLSTIITQDEYLTGIATHVMLTIGKLGTEVLSTDSHEMMNAKRLNTIEDHILALLGKTAEGDDGTTDHIPSSPTSDAALTRWGDTFDAGGRSSAKDSFSLEDRASKMGPELTELLDWAKAWLETATPEEKEAMWKAQRESWSRGPHGPTDGMGTVYYQDSASDTSNIGVSAAFAARHGATGGDEMVDRDGS